MAGTDQGNQFSGDVCRDSSYLIAKAIEKEGLGMNFTSQVTNKPI